MIKSYTAPCCITFVALLFCIFLTASSSLAVSQKTGPTSADKYFVIDGHVRHDVGALHNHVSNIGMIGAAPYSNAPYSGAPSGRWPGASGTDFLWSGGLWLGGVVEGEKRVSAGGWYSVLFPGSTVQDSIYQLHEGIAAGARFPSPGADDDGDGLVDEDPANGHDDDGDGLVDEDFAAISQQHFRCEMRDDTELAIYSYPDHKPLGLSIVQDSYQWDLPLITNAIGYEFTITNEGVESVQDVYLGMFGDFDIDDYAANRAGYWEGVVEASNGQSYPVSVAYMHDGTVNNPGVGYEGWLLLGHSADPTGIYAPEEVGVNAYRQFTFGDSPNGDSEQYQAMSLKVTDPPSADPGDYRILTSSGPFPTLLPGESLKYQVALVAGGTLEELKSNSAEMMACFQGRMFEVEGEAVRVHWIPVDEAIVAVNPGQNPSGMPNLALTAYPNPFNPRLEIRYAAHQEGILRLQIFDMRGRLVRSLVNGATPAGEGRIFWDGLNDQGRSVASGVYQLKLKSGGSLVQRRVTLVR